MLLLASLAHAAVLAAAHHGVATGEGIAWTSTLVVDAPTEVALVAPLPAELLGADTLVKDGVVTGLRLKDRRTVVRWTQPGHDTLQPPLVAGEAVQRVTLHGLRYTPDPALGLESHLGHATQPEIDRGRRFAVERTLGHPRANPIYVVADTRVVAAGGLAGTVAPGGETPRSTELAVAAIFSVVVGGLALATRLLGRRAQRVDRESYIREEFIRPR